MTRRARVAVIVLAGLAVSSLPSSPSVSAAQASFDRDPQQLKGTLLERMKREPPSYRGDNNARIKWEWYDGTARSYLFEKSQLIQEMSADSPHLLRADWVFRDVKVTFQEVFQLESKDDEKLLPILSYYAMLEHAPSSSFEGLTLFGKDGEIKGVITRKYVVATTDYPTTFVNVGLPRHPFNFVDALELKDPKTGKLEIASGNASDAINLRWKDIKTRVVDEMSEANAANGRRMFREAFAKSLKESIPVR